jgi:hypothetical protein
MAAILARRVGTLLLDVYKKDAETDQPLEVKGYETPARRRPTNAQIPPCKGPKPDRRGEGRVLHLALRERRSVEQKISYCEKRAALRPGAGANILKRKSVQKDIDRRMEPVRLEQMRQCVLGEAVAQAEAAIQEDVVKTVATIKRMNVAPDVLEDRLMQIVVGLDWDKHPKVQLDAIKAALVVNETLEIKRTGWVSLRASALRSI